LSGRWGSRSRARRTMPGSAYTRPSRPPPTSRRLETGGVLFQNRRFTSYNKQEILVVGATGDELRFQCLRQLRS
jgi:hypothetical protein